MKVKIDIIGKGWDHDRGSTERARIIFIDEQGLRYVFWSEQIGKVEELVDAIKQFLGNE